MKILVSSYEFPPIGGGGAKVVEGLTRTLAEAGHTIDIVTMHFKDLPFRERNGRIAIYRVPGIRRKAFVCTSLEMIPYIARALPLALRLARENRYDINHTHFIFPDGIIAWLVFRMTGLPYILTVHGSDVPGHNKRRFVLLHRLLTPLWRRVVRSAQLVICPSLVLENLVKKALPEAKTKVIPNGFCADTFQYIRPKEKRIVSVARIFEGKGIQHLLYAVQGVNLGENEVHIVGDGPYLPALKNIAAKNNLPVVFHGYMDNTSRAFKDLLETSALFVFPSEAENFPTVLLEAMAAGMAIITTKGTGCEEVVGDTAVLIRTRDVPAIRAAIQGLLEDTLRSETLGKAARRRLETLFAWPAIAAEHIKQYQENSSSRYSLP